jgi:hypothetical protein
LVQNGVGGDGGLSRLPIAQNQLALTPTHWNQSVDDLDARLQRDRHRRAIHDRFRITFDRKALPCGNGIFLVQRPSEWVYHAA